MISLTLMLPTSGCGFGVGVGLWLGPGGGGVSQSLLCYLLVISSSLTLKWMSDSSTWSLWLWDFLWLNNFFMMILLGWQSTQKWQWSAKPKVHKKPLFMCPPECSSCIRWTCNISSILVSVFWAKIKAVYRMTPLVKVGHACRNKSHLGT
jgi:hypothetical protein